MDVGRLHDSQKYKKEGQGGKPELCCHLEMRLDQKSGQNSPQGKQGLVFSAGICIGFSWESLSKDKQKDMASELTLHFDSLSMRVVSA